MRQIYQSDFFQVLGQIGLGLAMSGSSAKKEAEYCCKSSSLMWRRGNHRSIKGKIFKSSSLKTLYEIDGHWDRIVRVKDINSGEFTDIYNAKEVISRLNATIVKDPRELWPSDSAVVRSEVSQCILSKRLGESKRSKDNC